MPRKFDDLFDSDYYRDVAASALLEMEDDEKERWRRHPATVALLNTLMGDYIDVHQAWEDGKFTSESADGTAQMNAKSLGMLEAIRLVTNYVEELPYDTSEGVSDNS